MQIPAAPALSLRDAIPGFPAAHDDVSTVAMSGNAPSSVEPAPGKAVTGEFAGVA